MQALNIPTKINRGTVEIVSDVHLIKQSEKVGGSEATLLSKLGIKPFSYGLVLLKVRSMLSRPLHHSLQPVGIKECSLYLLPCSNACEYGRRKHFMWLLFGGSDLPTMPAALFGTPAHSFFPQRQSITQECH